MSKRNVPYAHVLLFSEKLLQQLRRSPSEEAHVKSLEKILTKKVEIKQKFTLKSYNKKDEMVLNSIRKKGKVDMKALEAYLEEFRDLVLSLPKDSYKKWKDSCRKFASNKNGKTIFVDNDTLNSISNFISKLPKGDSSDEIFEFSPEDACRADFKEALIKVFDQLTQNTAELKKLKKKIKKMKASKNKSEK
ncbi:hypothetical protein I6F53_06975 [Pseudoalteromonas sp. SWN29]|uniref:hypothetical protein n=1 Tax=Pseudoalteromonas sp. SWN29 TaxID=2792064 RepID=UPI0018CCD63C|nr:hypothetical protein [Pseudoalteromonas sp. SWN29]MBH0026722.1 hypothetical protein [Pseudoalteromonas sp. SWN29]